MIAFFAIIAHFWINPIFGYQEQACANVNGNCMNVANCKSTYIDGLCPSQPSNVKCCIQSPLQETECRSAGGMCQFESQCRGTKLSNYCPRQPKNVKCCKASLPNAGSNTIQGKMSTFGGPSDKGVATDEPLGIYSSASQRPELFLKTQPVGTTGLARRLNPNAYYIALRWDYKVTPKTFLRNNRVTVTNPRNGQSVSAWPVDWGPNEKTGRVADLSPGIAKDLGLRTNDDVQVIVPTP